MFDHVHLRAGDFARSCAFYRSVLRALGHADVRVGPGWMECGSLYLDSADHPDRVSRVHVCFAARSSAAVSAFHAAGLAAGGRCNGRPGMRPYHPGYFAAYLFDPDGNNIEAKADLR